MSSPRAAISRTGGRSYRICWTDARSWTPDAGSACAGGYLSYATDRTATEAGEGAGRVDHPLRRGALERGVGDHAARHIPGRHRTPRSSLRRARGSRVWRGLAAGRRLARADQQAIAAEGLAMNL